MKPGEVVTVVHGHGVPKQWQTAATPDQAIVGVSIGRVIRTRADGKVLVGLGDGGSMWIDPMWIDAGHTPTASARHRAGDPETARLAALAAEERLTDHQWLVLEALVHAGRNGLIDHEHEAHNGLIPTSAGKRRKELERLGLCEPTARTRTTGRALATVHQVTARGQAVWQHHHRGAA